MSTPFQSASTAIIRHLKKKGLTVLFDFDGTSSEA